MRTRVMTTLVMVASLLVSGQTLAQPPQLPTFQPGDVLRANDLNAIVEQIKRNMPASDGSGGATHAVDCSSGTIADAMSQAQPGDTILITGTCNEAVVVDKDGITLDGGGSAVIDGSGIDASVIAVIGHQNVTIKGLTVQNGLIGVHVGLGASAWLENVTAKDSRSKAGHNSGYGLLIANSSDAVLTGSIVATGNARNGVLVWQGGRASVVGNLVFEGTRMPQASLQANGNRGIGIEVSLGSSLQVNAADGPYSTLQANNNSGGGIWLLRGSAAQFGGGADVEASGNGDTGLVSSGSSAAFIGWSGTSRGFTGTFNGNGGLGGIQAGQRGSIEIFDGGVASSITAKGNTGWGYGLALSEGSTFTSFSPDPQSASVFEFSENDAFGIGVFRNSIASLRMFLKINDNGHGGVQAWGNSWVEVGLDTEGQTTISGNGGDGISAWNGVGIVLRNTTATGNTGSDASAGQGSRLDWSDSQVGTVYCDDTALAFNDASCPDGG